MPPVRYGKYSLVARLGAGGMAELFLARMNGTLGFEKVVAVKRILPHLVGEKEFVDMFLDEAKLVARINHPNVVQIFDFGEESGTYYIAMEYLGGADLATTAVRWMKQRPRMPVPEVCLAIAQAAAGLHAAHELKDSSGQYVNLVHRDVSPQNLFLTFDGVCKVLDFGVAKAAGRLSNTRTGNIKGKLAYMAPEQARSEAIDRRSDLFALGIVTWELLTGKRLFKADSEVATLQKVLACVVPPCQELNPEIPHDVAAVVHKALAPRPEDRFQTCEEFGSSLEDAMHANGFHIRNAQFGKTLRELMPERHQQSQQLLDAAAKGETSGVLDTGMSVVEQSLPNRADSRRAGANGLPAADRQAPLSLDDKTPSDAGVGKKGLSLRLIAGVSAAAILLTAGGLSWIWSSSAREAEERRQAVALATRAAAEKAAQEKTVAERAKQMGERQAAAEKAARLAEERTAALERSLAEAARREAEKRPAPAADKPREIRTAAATPAPPPAPVSAGKGFLTLDTSPWTQVYFGATDLGITPLVRVQLPSGKQKLTLKNPGKGISTTVEVEIQANELTARRFSL